MNNLNYADIISCVGCAGTVTPPTTVQMRDVKPVIGNTSLLDPIIQTQYMEGRWSHTYLIYKICNIREYYTKYTNRCLEFFSMFSMRIGSALRRMLQRMIIILKIPRYVIWTLVWLTIFSFQNLIIFQCYYFFGMP